MSCPIVHDGIPCRRAVPPPGLNGVVHALCPSDERALLRNAWSDHARADVLRSAVVGGIPIDEPRQDAPLRPRASLYPPEQVSDTRAKPRALALTAPAGG